MLGKLIKYDLKASAKLFILLHALFLAACLFCRVFFISHIDFNGPEEPLITACAIILALTLFLITALSLGTWLIVTFRFYRNLFSREGYLSWTLPVSGLNQLWAKIISGYVYMALDIILIAAGILILVTGRNVTDAYAMIASDVTEELGMNITSYALKIFLYSIAACISSVIMTYFCITIGQLFPGHRVLCALAAYFITSLVIQFISIFLMFALGYAPGGMFLISDGSTVADYTFKTLGLSSVLMFIVTILEYIATHIIIKKKVNLL